MVKSKSKSKSKSSIKQKQRDRLVKDLMDKGHIDKNSDVKVTDDGTAFVFRDKTGDFDKDQSDSLYVDFSKVKPESKSEAKELTKLKDIKMQTLSYGFEDREDGSDTLILDQQRVSGYVPKAKVVSIETSNVGDRFTSIAIDEYDSKGRPIAHLQLHKDRGIFDPEEVDGFNQGQLRAYVDDNNLNKDIPNKNKLGNKQLRIQIKKAMKKREAEKITDKKVKEFDELADKLIAEDIKTSQENKIPIKSISFTRS